MNENSSSSRADRELAALCAAFEAGAVARIPSGLSAVHAACIEAPFDPEPTLAISVGGSTTKLMLARVGGRRIEVIDALAFPNPPSDTPWETFFGQLVTRSAATVAFLREADRPRVGVSLAVPIRNGIPHHPSKIPTLLGLVSREPDRDVTTHHFGDNLARLLATFGAQRPRIAYQSDGVLAHLGAFFLGDHTLDTPTMLLVCGTGLACATRDEFILCGMACILPDDNPITAHAATEGGQYQHLIAGKGLWGMMRRSLIQAADQHHRPGLKEFAESFASPVDSVRVRNIALGEASIPLDASCQQLVRQIASHLVDNGANALANCAIASATHAFGSASSTPVQLLLEGSIALDPFILQRVQRRLGGIGNNYARLNIAPVAQLASPVDVTLVGAGAFGRCV